MFGYYPCIPGKWRKKMRKIKERVLAATFAAVMIVTGINAFPAKTSAMRLGFSTEEYFADGTDHQLPDDEWKELKDNCMSLMGKSGWDCSSFIKEVIDCPYYVNRTADEDLIKFGYEKIYDQVDMTDGNKYTSEGEALVKGLRRGDIIIFQEHDGSIVHGAIVNTDGGCNLYPSGTSKDGEITLFHGGVRGGVRTTRLSFHLSASKPGNHDQDILTVYRKKSNPANSAPKEYEVPEFEVTESPEDYENKVTIRYATHVQNYGWQKKWSINGEMSGTSGESKRLEGIVIKVTGPKNIGVCYNTHVEKYGWQGNTADSSTWKRDGQMSGTSGESKRLEAIQIKLTGEDAKDYSVYYRVHVQNYGWLGWAKDGEMAGSRGQSKRLEGIEIKILPKGEKPDGIRSNAFFEYGKGAENGEKDGLVNYMTHVQNYGDQSYVYDGSVSGTEGESKRLEGIRIKLNTDKTEAQGSIHYITHVQNYGWQGDESDISTWQQDGAFAGTSGESKRLEAIRIVLTGEMAEKYDIYYRVHVQNFGWLDWAKNGERAGSAGYSRRLEGIQIKLLPKGSAAPGDTTNCFYEKDL